MTLESKMLAALEVAVDDGNVYELQSGEVAFGLYGALSFMETLVGLCDKEERDTLFSDWVCNDASPQLVKDFLSQLIARTPVNYMTDHMEILAEKLLSRYSTEVWQMIRDRNKPGPIEAYKAARDAA